MDFNLPESFTITYEQHGNSVSMTAHESDCPGYLQNMVGPLEAGMAITATNWGDSYNKMKWLDGDTGCSGSCNGGKSHYSHIAITTGYSEFVVGPPCGGYDCGDECSSDMCYMHYPANDPLKWESKDVQCRCL